MRLNRFAALFSAASLILAPLTLVAGPSFAQDPPPPAGEQPAQQHDPNQPNWPGNMQNWDTSERESGPGNPGEAEERGLISPEVQESKGEQPTQQGTRAPDASVDGEAEAQGGGEAFGGSPLYAALHWARAAPVDLNGNPVPRPNPFASEPEADKNLTFPARPAPEAAPTEPAPAPAAEPAPANAPPPN